MKSRKEFETIREKIKKTVENKCVNCHATNNLHLHHIVPLSKGGTNNCGNIVFLCEICHSTVHNLNFKQHSELTKLGLARAKSNGKQIGIKKGTKFTTKKSISSKKLIQKYSQDFQGTLKDYEVIKLIGLSRNSYYKYKKELMEAL